MPHPPNAPPNPPPNPLPPPGAPPTRPRRARRHERSHTRSASGVPLGGAYSWNSSNSSGSGSVSGSASVSGSNSTSSTGGMRQTSGTGTVRQTSSTGSTRQRMVHPLPENPYRAANTANVAGNSFFFSTSPDPGPNPGPNHGPNSRPNPGPNSSRHPRSNLNFNSVLSPDPRASRNFSAPATSPGYARPALYSNLDPYNPDTTLARHHAVRLSSDEVVRLLHPNPPPPPSEELVDLVRPVPRTQNQNQSQQNQSYSPSNSPQPLYGPYAHPGPSHLPFSQAQGRAYSWADCEDDENNDDDGNDGPLIPDLAPQRVHEREVQRTPPPPPTVQIIPATPETRAPARVRTDHDRLVPPWKWTPARRERLLAEVLAAGWAVTNWELVANELQMPVNEVLRQMRPGGGLRERVLAAARGEKKCGCKCECFEGEEDGREGDKGQKGRGEDEMLCGDEGNEQ